MSVISTARAAFVVMASSVAIFIFVDTCLRNYCCPGCMPFGRLIVGNWTARTEHNERAFSGPRDSDVLPGIHHVIYINLEKRTDRRKQFESEMLKIGISKSSYTRIAAVAHEIGAMGCLMSHIKTLEYISAYYPDKNILVFEDDIKFEQNRSETHRRLLAFWENDRVRNNWNVLMLAKNLIGGNQAAVTGIIRVRAAYSTSAYLVHADYVRTLYRTSTNALDGARKNGFKEIHKIDVSWLKLQKQHHWFAFHPPLCTQRQSYSDVEKQLVYYGV